MGGVATLFSASFGGYILMLVKDSSSHLSLYEELRNLQADTVRELKDLTLHRAYGVKLPKLRAVWVRQGRILPLVKQIHLFLGPWLLVFQLI